MLNTTVLTFQEVLKALSKGVSYTPNVINGVLVPRKRPAEELCISVNERGFGLFISIAGTLITVQEIVQMAAGGDAHKHNDTLALG